MRRRLFQVAACLLPAAGSACSKPAAFPQRDAATLPDGRGWADGASPDGHAEPGANAPLETAGLAWRERGLSGPRPSARYGHSMAYASARGRALLFGGAFNDAGASPTTVFGDTWEWDGASGSWTDRSPPSSSSPPPRIHRAMVYDAARDRVVLFGGQRETFTAGYLQDLWEWDGATGTWSNRTPSPLPTSWPRARSDHAMTYVSGPASPRVLLFGGYVHPRTRLDDLWEWNGATWSGRTPSASWPEARSGHAMAADSGGSGGKVALFGGYSGSLGAPPDDLWEWNGSVWTNRTPSAPTAAWPPIRSQHAMTYDASRGMVLLFGGRSFDPRPLGDTWEWGTR